MTARDFTVAFHIGAHKTATSHLQRSLLRAHDALAEQGIRYYGPHYFRLPGRTIPALFGLKDRARPDDARRTPQEQLALMRKDASRLVISEENYIGVLNSPRRRAVYQRYPDAAQRVTALSAAIGQEIDVLLGVRQPTHFINSAYCQMLMGGRVMPMQRYRELNPLSGIDWLDLVRRLRAAPGVGKLTVWRYEDYAQIFPRIGAALVGDNAATSVTPLPKHIHVGLSSAAVAEVLHRHAHDGGDSIGYLARRILPIEEGYPPFDGYTEDEHASNCTVYDAQILEISALPGVALLTPQ